MSEIYINANHIKAACQECKDRLGEIVSDEDQRYCVATGLKSAIAMITAMADGVDGLKIVRCKNCVYWHNKADKDLMYCDRPGHCKIERLPSDFCSSGREKDEDGR